MDFLGRLFLRNKTGNSTVSTQDESGLMLQQVERILDAAKNGGLSAVQRVREVIPERFRQPVLDWAARTALLEDRTDEFRTLLDGGATREQQNADGTTLLHLAARYGKSISTSILIAAGAETNAQDHQGITPLMLAVIKKHPDVVRQLISAGASLALRNTLGDTALMFAADSVIRAQLIAAGAAAEIGQENSKEIPTQLWDWRTPSEMKMERDSTSGMVSRSVEEHAQRFLALWSSTEIELNWPKPGEIPGCNECNAAKPGRYPLDSVGDGFRCASCGRTIVKSAYCTEGNRYRHKTVIEIGRVLYGDGGTEAMEAVAYRFAAIGGRLSDLSRCWDGVGEWRH